MLHIETERCIVNIRINLHDMEGNEVTSIEIIPDQDCKLKFGSINTTVIDK